jgi:hypothetical protein
LEGSVVNGDVLVTDHVTVGGVFRLNGADIRGRLCLRGARFDGRDERGNTLLADAATIKGDVVLDADEHARFVAAGAIRLRRAEIGGDLSLVGASVEGTDRDGYSIFASYVTVTGGFTAAAGPGGRGLVVAGAVRLADSRLGGLHMSGGSVGGRRDARGYALAAHAVQVASQVTLGPGLELDGAVSLFGASMNQLRCQDLLVASGNRDAALVLDNATIRGNVECGKRVVLKGALKMFGASVGGNVVLDDMKIDGELGEHAGDSHVSLAADSIQVAGDLSLLGINTEGRVSLRSARVHGTLHVTYDGIGGRLSLASAQVAVLRDDPVAGGMPPGQRRPLGQRRLLGWGGSRRRVKRNSPHFPADCEIDLVGLRYDHISRRSDRRVRHRLAWLARLPEDRFHSQPHEHLALVYRSQGDDAAARLVAIDKHQRRLRDFPRWRFRRLPRWIFYVTVGHGYRPWLAGVWALVVIIAFTVVIDRADDDGIMIQNRPIVTETRRASSSSAPKPTVLAATPSSFDTHECDPRWQCLSAFGYAADTFFPGVNLGQDTTWRPDTSKDEGEWVRAAQWAVAAFGWFLATIFLAAVAGVVRRQ